MGLFMVNRLVNTSVCFAYGHCVLGPGLLESAYEECLCHELDLRRLPYERQKPLPVVYKDVHLDAGYRLDMLVDNLVVLELKAVEALLPIHQA